MAETVGAVAIPKTVDKQEKVGILSADTASTKVDKFVCKWYVHLEIWVEFTTPMGTPIGTQKSHLEPQGDHLSLQECVLKGAFQDLPFLLRLYTLNRVKTSDFWIALCGRNVVNSVSKQHFSQPFSKLGF